MTTPLVERVRSWGGPTRSEAGPALEEAMGEHWLSVCTTLFRLLGDWQEAQDLALETFWRLHRRGPRDLDTISNLGGWLYRVATNLGLNALRARGRRQRYEELAGAIRLQRAASVDPAEEMQRREEQAQVRHVLAHMKPRSAQLLILRYTDHTYAEIADILGVACSSVGTLLARAETDFERRYRLLETLP